MKQLDPEKLDALLMDLLYEEEPDVEGQRLDPDAEPIAPELREKVESEYAEVLAAYRNVQVAYREMPEDDPAPSVSSALLREADRVTARASWLDRFLALFRSPGMSIAGVAAAVMLVAGVTFFVSSRAPGPEGDSLGDPVRIDRPMATSVPNPAAVDEDRLKGLEGLDKNADEELEGDEAREEAPATPAFETGTEPEPEPVWGGGKSAKTRAVTPSGPPPVAKKPAPMPKTTGASKTKSYEYKKGGTLDSLAGGALAEGDGEAASPAVLAREAALKGRCAEAEKTARGLTGAEAAGATLEAAECYLRAGKLAPAKRLNAAVARAADAKLAKRATVNLARIEELGEAEADSKARPAKKASKKAPASVDALE